jgi:hypothetical protein
MHYWRKGEVPGDDKQLAKRPYFSCLKPAAITPMLARIKPAKIGTRTIVQKTFAGHRSSVTYRSTAHHIAADSIQTR